MDNPKEYMYLDDKFYKSIKEVLEESRKRIYRNIQSEMVQAYWQIGKMIVEKQGGKERAEYGNGLIKELSIQLTRDFGKAFAERNLRYIRMFYLTFPIWNAVRAELSWIYGWELKCIATKGESKLFIYSNGEVAKWMI